MTYLKGRKMLWSSDLAFVWTRCHAEKLMSKLMKLTLALLFYYTGLSYLTLVKSHPEGQRKTRQLKERTGICFLIQCFSARPEQLCCDIIPIEESSLRPRAKVHHCDGFPLATTITIATTMKAKIATISQTRTFEITTIIRVVEISVVADKIRSQVISRSSWNPRRKESSRKGTSLVFPS